MNRNSLAWVSAWIVALTLVPSPPVSSQSTSGGTYTIRKFVIAGGGGQPQGAPYRAAVTVGQSVAQVSNGGGYRLVSGFHHAKGSSAAADTLFCSSFENTACTSGVTP
jgi:hypothetical protein